MGPQVTVRRTLIGVGCFAALASGLALGRLGAQDAQPGLSKGAAETPLVQAQNDVELLEAHLDVHKAVVEEAEARLKGASQRLDLLTAGTGATPGSQVVDARALVDILKAHLKVRRAEKRVTEVVLKQAKRRLAQVQGDRP